MFNNFVLVRWLLIYFLFISLLGAYAYDQPLSRTVLPGTSRQAMFWIRDNLPADSTFLLLTGNGDPFGDPVQEWFPVYSERISVATIQGREWTLGKEFLDYAEKVSALQVCLNESQDCLSRQAADLGLTFDFLYILKKPVAARSGDPENPGLLRYLLGQSPLYEMVFENDEVIIFEVHRAD